MANNAEEQDYLIPWSVMKLRKNASLQAVAKEAALQATRLERNWSTICNWKQETTDSVRRNELGRQAHEAFKHWMDVKLLADHISRLAGKG